METMYYFIVFKHGYVVPLEMAEKVVCLAAVRRSSGPIFLRLLCGPQLQAAQGHYQFRFVWTGKCGENFVDVMTKTLNYSFWVGYWVFKTEMLKFELTAIGIINMSLDIWQKLTGHCIYKWYTH